MLNINLYRCRLLDKCKKHCIWFRKGNFKFHNWVGRNNLAVWLARGYLIGGIFLGFQGLNWLNILQILVLENNIDCCAIQVTPSHSQDIRPRPIRPRPTFKEPYELGLESVEWKRQRESFSWNKKIIYRRRRSRREKREEKTTRWRSGRKQLLLCGSFFKSGTRTRYREGLDGEIHPEYWNKIQR